MSPPTARVMRQSLPVKPNQIRRRESAKQALMHLLDDIRSDDRLGVFGPMSQT